MICLFTIYQAFVCNSKREHTLDCKNYSGFANEDCIKDFLKIIMIFPDLNDNI